LGADEVSGGRRRRSQGTTGGEGQGRAEVTGGFGGLADTASGDAGPGCGTTGRSKASVENGVRNQSLDSDLNQT
jgi:hypothetical protein